MTVGDAPPQLVVVEDDEGLRAAMMRMLHAAGWRVRGYESAEAMLEALLTSRRLSMAELRCMVLDLCLPGLSGFELLSRLQEAGFRPQAILITAHDDPSVKLRAKSVGAFAYLAKPFTGNALVAAVREATGDGKALDNAS